MPMNLTFLKALREYEARSILPLLPPDCRLLEIGAGAGWQAAVFAAGGHDVQAVDILGSQYRSSRIFPVAEYDGRRLPFQDESFDVVFTSSVLEHLDDIAELDHEIRRVLRSDGMAVHVMPRGRWCLWTMLTHWLGGVRHFRAFLSRPVLSRHGAKGHWFSEPFLFTKRRWLRQFHCLEWEIVGLRSNQLVYSGNLLLGNSLSLKARKTLAVFLGGVCQVYILRPKPQIRLDDSSSARGSIMKESSFSFGKNWKKYLRSSYSAKRLATARDWLLNFLEVPDLKGLVFLDIGCGSGIHSLAAWESGAQRVISIDVDPDSIEAAETLKASRGDPENWEIRKGSILDTSLTRDIPSADIVYSWGVLHHTGDLWRAMENSSKFLKPGSLFYIAIYVKNQHDPYWISIKKRYNASGWWWRRGMEAGYVVKRFLWPPFPKRIAGAVAYIASYRRKRGMSFMTDVRDWLGGWPYEPATVEEVTRFCLEELGLQKIRIRTGEANIEYLFVRPTIGT